MSLFDSRLFSWMRPRTERGFPPLSARAVAGGRQSVDSATTSFGLVTAIVAPPDFEGQWRMEELDVKAMNRMAPARLMRLMLDLSPEISAGIWNFLRLCNPGWELEVLRVGSDEDAHELDTRGQAAAEAFLAMLPGVYAAPQQVPLDTVINTLFLGAFLRGAFFAELVLDDAGRVPLNIATPDPASARFRRVSDEQLGTVYELGQWQNGQWVPLDSDTIRYVPIDPAPSEPYGRPLVSPALFAALFLLGMLHDMRRVVQQQGYPRIDLPIILEKLYEIMPANLEQDPEKVQSWVEDVVNEIRDAYAKLEPDDAYVHLDVVEVNRPVGAVDAFALAAVDNLIAALERMISRGLKLMPLVMGINDATTETNANRQWEIQAASIKSIQHLLETVLEHLISLALQVQGIRGTVRFRFAELRAAEMLHDEQTKQMQITNANEMYKAGWISQDEASEMVTGHPADVPEPRAPISGVDWPFNVDPANEDRGYPVDSHALLAEIRAARQAVAEEMESRSNGHR